MAAEDDIIALGVAQGMTPTGPAALPPEYLVFVRVRGFPLWPAWILPPGEEAKFMNEPLLKQDDNYARVLRGGEGDGGAGGARANPDAPLGMSACVSVCMFAWAMLPQRYMAYVS